MSPVSMKIFSLGNSVVVDPATRKVVSIDGRAIDDSEHSADMQEFADAALADLHEPDPRPDPAADPADV